MAGEDIRIANSVRQILGRHYIKSRGVRIMALRGDVRIIGKLERAEGKANMPIDSDYLNKLKNEIRRINGVRNVAISARDEEPQPQNEHDRDRVPPQDTGPK